MGAPEHEERCPRCGTPYSPSQEYCLECGAKLPTRSGVVALLGSAWRKRLGWYPGDWIWPSLLALFHWRLFPGSGPWSLNRSLGVPT